MEIKTIQELTNIALKTLPKRKTENNECIFCKKDLNLEKWCNCLEAQKVNWLYKKIIKKIDYWNERVIVDDTDLVLRLLGSARVTPSTPFDDSSSNNKTKILGTS